MGRKIRTLSCLLSLIAVPALICGALIIVADFEYRQASAEHDARMAPFRRLTDQYGDEARAAVERYWDTIGSREADANSNVLAEIMTGPLLEASLTARRSLTSDDRFWELLELDFRDLCVLEYDTAHMKVYSYQTAEYSQTTDGGEILEPFTAWFQGIMVFAKEDDTWKTSAMFNFIDRATLARDWEYSVLDWEKQQIGDIFDHASARYSCSEDVK